MSFAICYHGCMPSSLSLNVQKVSKRYAKSYALKTVSFQIPPGKLVALIGPNGSGKTTLLKTIVGLIKPTTGSIYINNFNIQTQPIEAKSLIGYVPDNPTGFEFLSGLELLRFSGQMFSVNVDKALIEHKELLNVFGLKQILNSSLREYSRGSRQKLAFLAALIHTPKLLLIDEPIVGLDPESIEIFGSTLKKFTQNGGTVMFSTHILDFGKRFANHVLFLHQGKLKLDQKVSLQTSLNKHYQRLTQD